MNDKGRYVLSPKYLAGMERLFVKVLPFAPPWKPYEHFLHGIPAARHVCQQTSVK